MLSNLQPIFPNFVLHKSWDMPEAFNNVLGHLARGDAKIHKVRDETNPANLGDKTNHFGHIRHNLLSDQGEHPTVQTLVDMARQSVNEYLLSAYGYVNEHDIDMVAETFYQQRAGEENVGVFTHSHLRADLVCTYYPVVDFDEGYEDTPLHSGALRFYDPSGKGNRLWKNLNPEFHTGAWYQVTPRVGSMVVFEGHMPHDSTFFQGDERICIPIQCDLLLPNRQQKVRVSNGV
jgi:hypothetical protein